MIDSEDLLQRFVSYVSLDTQADPHSTTTPSTEKQWALIRQLEGELRELGLADRVRGGGRERIWNAGKQEKDG